MISHLEKNISLKKIESVLTLSKYVGEKYLKKNMSLSPIEVKGLAVNISNNCSGKYLHLF